MRKYITKRRNGKAREEGGGGGGEIILNDREREINLRADIGKIRRGDLSPMRDGKLTDAPAERDFLTFTVYE